MAPSSLAGKCMSLYDAYKHHDLGSFSASRQSAGGRKSLSWLKAPGYRGFFRALMAVRSKPSVHE